MNSIFSKIFCIAAFSLIMPNGTFAQSWVQWSTSAGGNGHWYKAVVNTNNLNWEQVNQLARNQGGYLATITSAAENGFVFSLINSPEFFQGNGGNGSGPAIGGYQPINSAEPDGGWQWETGEAWGYTNWTPPGSDFGQQPDDGGGIENRAQFFSGSQGVPAPTWNDLPSTDSNLGGYVIERDNQPVPAPSGFYGQAFIGASGGSLLTRVLGIPVRTSLSVYDLNGKLVTWVISNPVGQFYSYLKPGRYLLVATPLKQKTPPSKIPKSGSEINSPVTVWIAVQANQLTPVEIDY